MWWLRDPERLKAEVAAIDGLRENERWLTSVAYRPTADLALSVDFVLTVGADTFQLELSYPQLFPETPPSMIPRDGRRISGHQYGRGGELCLELRSDNWDPSFTGAMMIESAHRLISGEREIGPAPAEVLSAHRTTLGQELRGSLCRFLLTRTLGEILHQLTTGDAYVATVTEIFAPKSYTAFVQSVHTGTGANFHETGIPGMGRTSTPAVLVVVDSPKQITATMDDTGLQELVKSAHAVGTLHEPRDDDGGYFVVIAAEGTARLYFSFPKDGARAVVPYDTIDLTADNDLRLGEDMAALPAKRVGIIGCGSIGSKIAASLARSGVGGFVLVDDDVLKPSNLVRNDLDARVLGAHKADGLDARLKAISAVVTVSVRRVALGGQEPSGTVASVLDELATCDLLVDATADPHAFNFIASVARGFLRPMIWAEVYAGGIGGFVGRLRPGIEPPPHAARAQYFGWCRAQGVEPPVTGDRYGADGGKPLIASDADVSVIAAHAARMAVDVLARGENSHFAHPAYVIGLEAEWIFTEPFDTRPIQFVPAGDWKPTPSPETTKEAIEFVLSLIKGTDNAA
jgi:sulfur-carrier protein adenylyltransferase/sulfurtransferase